MQKGGNKVAGVRGKAVGNHLSAEDETIVRNFVSEFVGQKLIPHLEAVLKNLNEWVGELWFRIVVIPFSLCTYYCIYMCTCV